MMDSSHDVKTEAIEEVLAQKIQESIQKIGAQKER